MQGDHMGESLLDIIRRSIWSHPPMQEMGGCRKSFDRASKAFLLDMSGNFACFVQPLGRAIDQRAAKAVRVRIVEFELRQRLAMGIEKERVRQDRREDQRLPCRKGG